MRTDIKQSVGRNGRNLPNDVDTVVHLVNMHRRRTGKSPLSLRTGTLAFTLVDHQTLPCCWEEIVFRDSPRERGQYLEAC